MKWNKIEFYPKIFIFGQKKWRVCPYLGKHFWLQFSLFWANWAEIVYGSSGDRHLSIGEEKSKLLWLFFILGHFWWENKRGHNATRAFLTVRGLQTRPKNGRPIRRIFWANHVIGQCPTFTHYRIRGDILGTYYDFINNIVDKNSMDFIHYH